MVLVVETGWGVLGAEAYASVEYVDQFHAARGGNPTWDAADLAAKEAALRHVTDFLDTNYLSGYQQYAWGQGLAYPFEGLDPTAQRIAALQRATALLAPLGLSGPLLSQAPREATVLSRTEKVGDLSESVTYADDGDRVVVNGMDVGFLDRLLQPVRFNSGMSVGRRQL